MGEYGGFWSRLWARTIDIMVVLPLASLNYWFWADSRRMVMFAALPLSLLTPAYLIILHGLRGQSFGKIALGLKIESISGGRVSWPRVIARFSPVALFQVVWGVGVVSSTHALPDILFQTASFRQKARLIHEGMPHWVQSCISLYTLWVFADVIVLTVSSKKRSIHDLLAGTVFRQSKASVAIQSGQAG